MAIRRPVSFVGKAEYLDSWKTRRLLPALGMIPVDRQSGRQAMHNQILSNHIYSNRVLGIDLNGDSVTKAQQRLVAGLLPSPGPGANGLTNSPLLYLQPDSGAGSLDAAANEQYIIQIFSSVKGNVSGWGEGQHLLRTLDVTTDTNGFAWFELPKPPAGEVISATATDSDHNTSEFSQCAGPHDHLFTSGFEFSCSG